MTNMVDGAYIYKMDYNTNSDVITPKNFSYNKWNILEETMNKWLQTKIVLTNLPLPYVVLNTTTPLTVDQYELII